MVFTGIELLHFLRLMCAHLQCLAQHTGHNCKSIHVHLSGALAIEALDTEAFLTSKTHMSLVSILEEVD